MNNDAGLIGEPEETRICFQFVVNYIYESIFLHTVVWLYCIKQSRGQRDSNLSINYVVESPNYYSQQIVKPKTPLLGD